MRAASRAAVLSGGGSPSFRADFTAMSALPSSITHTRAGNAMMFDATGKLTWAPNNQLLNSATLSTQNVTTIPANYVLSIKGTGSVTLTGTSTAGPLTGTGVDDRVNLAFTPTAGTLTLTVAGSVTSARLSLVTYETTMRAMDDVDTAGSIYYGPRFNNTFNVANSPLGLLSEGARTNVVLWNRDLTNVAWVATTMTTAKTATGIDGVANSASTITATGANATLLQTVTLLSSARFQSAYVKRRTGTGVVNMTTDNGVTWTAVTVTADWTRVTIPTQTLANPVLGFRIVTSGDAIDVDMVQNENGVFATSPIFVTTAATTRVEEFYNLVGNILTIFQSRTFSVLVEFSILPGMTSNYTKLIWFSGGSLTSPMYLNDVSFTDLGLTTGPASLTTPVSGLTALSRAASSSKLGGWISLVGNNGAVGILNGNDYPADISSCNLGTISAEGTKFHGHFSRFAIWNKKVGDTKLKAITVAGASL